jgi:NAD(P)-dependent dehydrogenase (short-subunit alcohol dehydrogenase family)
MEHSSRIALVTGANRGLGREVARRLAQVGLEVWVGARTPEHAEAAAADVRELGGRARPVAIDVTDVASVERAAALIEETSERLDVLVNNAGVMLDGAWVGNTAPEVSDEVLRTTFDVNLFGVVRVTRAMLPLLRKSRDASIVNVSSVMGSLGIHAQPDGPLVYTKPFAYDASKAALNAFTVHLAAAVRDDGILVNSGHPGWVRTTLGTDAAELSIEEGAQTLVELALLRQGGPTATFTHAGNELPW